MKGDGCGEQARRDRRFKQMARLKGRRGRIGDSSRGRDWKQAIQ